MQNPYRTRLLLLLGTLALLITAAIIIPPVRKAYEDKKKPRTLVFRLKEDTVTRFDLLFDNTAITAVKTNGGWRIIAPAEYPGDMMEMTANVKNFNTLSILTIITNPAGDYGLDKPTAQFSIWEGKKQHTIVVGKRTFDEEGYYIRYGKEYFAVEAIFIDALKKSVKDLRNKDFMDIVSQDVIALSIDNGISFKRISRTNWSCAGVPVADTIKIVDFIQRIERLKATGFAPDDAKPEFYGFAYGITMRVALEDATSREVRFAKRGETAYAIRTGDPVMYEVDASFISELKRPASFYQREKTATNAEGTPK
ncbi:MAG: DUF4340 domain-containing protein [Spirochaetes bacterium]|nr:DUF4340 domain-containing protein [Spirochaetota bacterium]